jgi:digeranylgeranylglycerophospholipid reductase
LPNETIDIAIVGCGVSGATAALAATQSGAKVSIFEEHTRVGEPSHCSGHVGIMAFKRFSPQIPEKIIENRIKGAVLHSPSGEQLTLYRSQPVTWVLNRTELDRHLASLATDNGAELHLNSCVDGFKRSFGGGFELKIGGRAQAELSCRMLIDAGGCGAPISKYASLSALGSRVLVNSAQINVEDLSNVNEDLVEVYFGQHYAPGFFGWIIPRRDGSAKVGIAAGARANVRQCFERFVKKHPIVSSKLRHAKFLTKPMYHPIPVGGAKQRTYSDGILAVGDAASQVKPTTGGGIVFSLVCGKIAGKTAAKAVQLGDTSSTYLRGYERSWRKLLGFDLTVMTWLRKLLYRLPDSRLDRIFGAFAELNVDDVLNRTSDIDFQGRTLLSLDRDPRLLVTLLSASILSVPSLLHRNGTHQQE